MDGTNGLRQLLLDWAAEDATMADLYEEIKFSEIGKLWNAAIAAEKAGRATSDEVVRPDGLE